MILFCHECNENHYFKPKEVERIIYCMQGDRCDILGAALHTTVSREELKYHPEFECLKCVLSDSYESELYAEFTSSQRESRVRIQWSNRRKND
jgi:hypothetical protein